jgi:peptidoglycan hydrolase CwlO-like protein
MENERQLLSLERRVQELEDKVYRAEQQAREAIDEVDRLKSRVQTLEWER